MFFIGALLEAFQTFVGLMFWGLRGILANAGAQRMRLRLRQSSSRDSHQDQRHYS